MATKLNKEARTAAREIQRSAVKAVQQARAARIRNFENHHDLWRQLVGLPPLVRRADGRPVGVLTREGGFHAS